jgi:hypothetical protein
MPREGAPRVYTVPEDWLRFTQATSINVRDIWTRHFEPWAGNRGETAATLALAQFAPIAQEFIGQQREDLNNELASQQDWIAERSREIAVPTQPGAVQTGLFTASASAGQPAAREWMSSRDPQSRLEGFSKDPSEPPSKRSLAEVALRVHRVRVKELNGRLEFQSPEVIKLGLLMIIPRGPHGA